MKLKFILNFVFSFFALTLISQTINPVPGTPGYINSASLPNAVTGKKGGGQTVFNGNEAINTSYTATACGLNYTSVSFNLHQRVFSGGYSGTGVVQPAPFNVTGIVPCGRVLKAFLYTALESNSFVPITATVTNPAGTNFSFPMTPIGSAGSLCWGYTGTQAYRADITSAITTNGTYLLSGFPVFPSPNDVDGASLFIIYTDESQNYTGSIVIADGMISASGPASLPGYMIQTSYSGFSVCANPSVTENFLAVADLQAIGDFVTDLNGGAPTVTVAAASQIPWMLISQNATPVSAGQTSVSLMTDLIGGDCYGIVMAGMYYRTNCLTCPTPMTVTAVTSTCLPTGSATVSVLNGMPNTGYSWSGSVQTTSVVTGLAPGVHSVTVSDPFNCKAAIIRTVNIVGSMSLTASGSSCAATNSAAAFVAGGTGPFAYTWSGTAQTTSLVTNLGTGAYTVTAVGACQTRTASVNVTASSSIAVTNTALCIGYSTTMTASTPLNSYTWSPILNITSAINSPTVVANPTTTTIYTVSGTNSVNCVSSNTLQLFVVPTQTIPILNPTTCVGSALQLTANATYTGSSYQWTGPAAFTSTLQNPIRTPATLAMSGSYSIVVMSAPGCTSSAVANVTVFPIPTTPSITSNAPICSGFQLNLAGSGGTTYFWQGPNTFTSNLQNVAIANATNTLHSGIYTLTARFATGCSSMFTRSITVRALPVPTITSNSPVCLGKPLTLFGTGGLFYNWTGPNGFVSGVQNPGVASVAFASAGIYSMTTTDGFGCQGNTTHSVTVLGNPTITAINGSTVCYGYQGPLTVTSAGGGAYTWSGPGGTFAVQNPTVSSVNNLSMGVYTVTVGNAMSTCTSQATATLATIPIPVITATGASVCDGQPATLFSNGAQTYTWTGPAAYTSNLQNPTINPVTNLTINTYTVAGTALNSCTASTTATLQARANPTVTTTGTTVCFAAPATLLAGGGVSYSWTGPGGYTSAVQNPQFASVTNLTTDTYTVVVTAANACTTSGTATLTTKPNPTVTPTGTTVCLNLPAMVSASASPNGVTFSWSGPGGYTASGATANIASASSAATQIYTVVGTAPNSCTHQVVANLNTFPLPTVTATGTLICLYEPFTLSASGATSYVWTGPSIPGAVSSPTVFIPVVDGSSVGNYVVIGTGANSCSNIATANVSTLALPPIAATGTTVCYGEPAILKATGGVQSGYTWTGPANYSYTMANAYVASADNNSQGVYMVVGTAPNSCTASATATLNFYNLPVPSFTAPTRVCLRSSMVLQGAGATTYTWTGPYAYLSTVPSVTIPVYNTLQAGTYTLGVTDTRGCFQDTTLNIIIDPSPGGVLLNDNGPNSCVPYCANFTLKANADGSPITNISWLIGNRTYTGTTFNYCVTKVGANSIVGSFTNALGCANKVSYDIMGNPTPTANFEYLPFVPVESVDEVKFTNTSMGEEIEEWSWHFINNKGHQSKEQHPTYVFEDAGTYAVAMVTENKWGCVDTVVKTIKVDADFKLYIPNAFTPNGDGLNDVFQPKGRGIQKYHLKIYDRWGSVVFETQDFMQGWDGGEKGKQITDEVYTWRIEAVDVGGNVKEYTGHVTLTR